MKAGLHRERGRFLGLKIRSFGIYVWRRNRSGRGTEWHNHNKVTYFHLWWGSPTKHCWWAASIYIYLRGA